MEHNVSSLENVAEEVSALQGQIDELAAKLEPLEKQIKPVKERIKLLKKRQTDLKTTLCPLMHNAETNRVMVDNVTITYKADSKKMAPMKSPFLEKAIGAFFAHRGINIPPAVVVEFIERYRKENKIVAPAVTIRKSKQSDNNAATTEMEVSAESKSEDAHVEPYKF